jgi:hypothetical protein
MPHNSCIYIYTSYMYINDGLQVAKLHRTKRTREMRLARKYMEAVSIANKRLLESHVRRKRSCVVWGAAVGNTGKVVRWPPTPRNPTLSV